MACQATIDYEKDAMSYELAQMTKNSIYATNMGLIKDAVYTLIGKPYMFDELGKPYVPPNTTDVTSLPGWFSGDASSDASTDSTSSDSSTS